MDEIVIPVNDCSKCLLLRLFLNIVFKFNKTNIVACSRKPEYLNQSDRPFLDNGSVTRFSVSLSRLQL
jgi:hypothetical protein